MQSWKNLQFWPSGGVMLEFYIQLFRERLSEKVHANNPERYCRWFWVHCSSNNFERMTRKAIDVFFLWVPKESNKSSLDSFSVRNSVLIISHITFQDCRVRIFPTIFLEIAVSNVRHDVNSATPVKWRGGTSQDPEWRYFLHTSHHKNKTAPLTGWNTVGQQLLLL